MADRKVLLVSHNHPAVRPGGAEAYALELYEAMRDSEDFDPVLLARSGPPVSGAERPHEGTLLQGMEGDPDQYLFYTDVSHYDWLFGRSPDKRALTTHFRDFLLAHRPDVVHFQHTLFLGYDAVRVARATLPDAAIVYTLHELLPICHNNGQMVRTGTGALCHGASPRRCHECFPSISPQMFFLRKRFIQSHLALVDLFTVPSRFLYDRYLAWGIPPERLHLEEYGRLRPPAPRRAPVERAGRNRFGFFGQLSYFKGVDVLLRAFKELGEDFDGRLMVRGANLELQPQPFRDEFDALLEDTEETVSFGGAYDPGDVSGLMADVDWVVVPSIWWENSPLVIQEAFAAGRPVICSDIGGMAEKVTDGVNGLHFRRANAQDLAAVLERAATTPGLWDELRAGIPSIYGMEEHLESLNALYDLAAGRPSGREEELVHA
jgi:glycosyltransferase involved in cell wall biosynthesis